MVFAFVQTPLAASFPAVAVCVPARDEAALLPRLLEALDRQTGTDPRRLHVCLFFDGCLDDGIALARARATTIRCHLHLAVGERGAEPNAGRARAAAMLLGLQALDGEADPLLLSTDADSAPRSDWIAMSCHALMSADVIAGRIVREGGGDDLAQTRIETYYDRLYALRRAIDPVAWEPPAAHHFTSGASLGFRIAAYTALGGFRAQPSGEDALIVDEAARAGLRVRRDWDVVVETSSRRDGRALGGLASTLNSFGKTWAEANPVRVAHPADQAWQWRAQSRARAAFENLGQPAVRATLAAAVGLTPDHLIGVARDCPNPEAFAMRVVPTVPGGERRVTLPAAERLLSSISLHHLVRAA